MKKLIYSLLALLALIQPIVLPADEPALSELNTSLDNTTISGDVEVAATTVQARSIPGVDVSRFFIVKGQDYFQTTATNISSISTNSPFRFTASVEGSATDSLLAASVKLPNLQTRTLTNSDGTFDFEAGFSNKFLLDAAYSAGNYLYTIVGQHDGTNKPALILALDNYPTIPKVANWNDLQAVEALQPLDISWNTFTNGSTNDFIMLDISETNGSLVVSTPALLVANALNGTNLVAQIPANSLADGVTYEGRLMFLKRTMLATNYSGAKGLSGYFRQTKFPIVTLPTPPSNGRIQFSASAFSARENSSTASITVTRSGDTGAVSVDFATLDGTAYDGQDYHNANQTVNFADGETVKNISVTPIDNSWLDGNRTVNLALANVQGGAILGDRTNAVLTILDDEIAASGKFQFGATNHIVAETTPFIDIPVNRVGGSTGTSTVDYVAFIYHGDTAVPNLNYTPTNGTLTFGPGAQRKLIRVGIVNNSLVDSNAFFHVGLSNPTGGAAFGSNIITRVSIINDDRGGTFAFKQKEYVANENSTNFTVTVVRTGGAASGVTVDFTTVDGTAQAGVRYVATNGTLSFGSNEMSKSFQVGIVNDTLFNSDQSFTVQLANATGGAAITANTNFNTSALKILDDESSVGFTNANYIVGENVGTFRVTIVREGALITPASVDFSTVDDTATSGLDYRGTNGTLVFPIGVKSKTISLTISNDTLVENDETFHIELTNPTNCLLNAPILTVASARIPSSITPLFSTTVTITNNDFGGVINFSTNSYTVSEDRSSDVITLVRSNGLASAVAVDFITTDGSAVTGTDYSNATQTVVFNAGEIRKRIHVPIIQNTLVGGPKTVLLALTNVVGGASLGANTAATLNITNDNLGGTISFVRTNYSAFENATNFYVNVLRTGGKASGVTVDYYTEAGTATENADYNRTTGTLTFAAGETSKTIAVGIINDTLAEGLESFKLHLANVYGGGTLGSNNTAVLNIIDDESSISISNATVNVGEGDGKVIVTLVRSGSLTTAVAVDFATANGSATAGLDYGATNGTVNFPANVSTKTITIPIVNDTIAEGNENFSLAISNPQGGTQLGTTTTQIITIVDNDLGGAIQFGATSFTGYQGSNAVVKISRTGGIASGVTVAFNMSGGTAVATTDYANATQTVTFAAGETNKTILVALPFNTLNTTSRTVNLSLATATGGATLGANTSAVLTIQHQPDPNAVSITGPVFMSANLNGIALNVTPPTPLGSTVNGVASTSFKLQVTWANGALNIFDFEGVPFATGTTQMDNSGSHGIMLYTKTPLTIPVAQGWAVADGSATVGSYGTVIIDAIDTSTKTVSGRFSFHALSDVSGSSPAVLEVTSGKFRTHYF